MSAPVDDFAALLAKVQNEIERGQQHSPRNAALLEEISFRLRKVAAAGGLSAGDRANLRRSAAEAGRLSRLIRQWERPRRERPRRPVRTAVCRGLRRFAPRRRRSTSGVARASPSSAEADPDPIGGPCGLYERRDGRWRLTLAWSEDLAIDSWDNEGSACAPLRMTRAQAARFIEVTAATAPHMLPVARAMVAGHIGLSQVWRGKSFPRELRRPTPKPVLVVVGDDDHRSTGPSGFPAAKRLARWAKAVMVHGCGAEAAHYAEAVRATIVLGGGVVIIETDPAHIAEWAAFFGDGQLAPLLIVKPGGGIHPKIPERLQ